MRRTGFARLFICLIAWPALSTAADLSRALVLVAQRGMQDPLYGRTVILAAPFGSGQHFGFIVNRPTGLTLGKLFPQHAPSQKIADPVFLGGPMDTGAIFALVARRDSPGGQSIEIMPGVFAAFDGATVDRIIEANPHEARFLAGLVVWKPGELGREIEQGAWHVLEPDAALLGRDPKGLWEALVTRSQLARGFIRTAGH